MPDQHDTEHRASPAGRPGWRELLTGGAHLAGLWAIAMVQPLLDVLGNSPEFFVARGNTAADILLLALVFALGPPLVLLGVESLLSLLGRKAYMAAHLGFVALISAVFFVQLEKRIFAEPTILIVALALGLGAAVAYSLVRARFMKAILDVLAAAPVVVVALFLFFSNVSSLVLPQDEAQALGGTIESKPPVVVVVFDELPTATLIDRNEEVRANRYPGFAELARESTWYLNNSTVADFSGRAVPAVMTGNNPTGDRLPIAADHPNNIFTLLGGDLEFHVDETLTQLCPTNLCEGSEIREPRNQTGRMVDLYRDLRHVLGRVVLPPAIADDLPNVSTTFGGFGLEDPDVPDRKRAGNFVGDNWEASATTDMAGFFRQIPATRRALSLIHMELPHEPFRLLPDGRAYNYAELSNLNTDNAAYWAVGPYGIALAEQRHQLQTGYADRLVGLMIDRLKSTGIWEEAMVVVTSDHGLQFDEDVTRRIATGKNLGGVASAPLFVKYPGQTDGELSRRHARTVDIVPTIADVLGVSDMYETEGVSLLGPDPEAPVRIRNARGEMVVGEVAEMIRQREAMVRQTAERLGDGNLYELGPRPELLGREPPPVGDREIAELDRPELWEGVERQPDRLPLFVTGTVGEEVEPGTELAITVNGEVAATTRVFLFDEVQSFGAVAPPWHLESGRASIGVYEATPDGELVPLGGN